MNHPLVPPSFTDQEPSVAEKLRRTIKGEVRFDKLSRTIYATDASIYEIIPLGVVLPKDTRDVVETVKRCRDENVSIVARGGGTGLTGAAVGPGVQLDFSRYMNRIGPLDAAARTITVQPGVVLDELNARLASHGLRFAPDVATSSRATLGGMIANNSCGAHSIIYGRTVDHIAELTVVLADGEVATFGSTTRNRGVSDDRASRIEKSLAHIRDKHHEEIEKRFPRVLRSSGGYGLDRLGPPGTTADAIQVLCGSEGTLALVVEARLKLVPIPKYTGLAVLHFEDLLSCLDTVPAILAHKPAAVELVDHHIVQAGRENLAIRKRCDFLQGNPIALLVVEFFGDGPEEVAARIEQLSLDVASRGRSYALTRVLDAGKQQDVWNLRKSGLGLLMSKAGDAQPHAFVEDSAVDPARLREYIERFTAVLDREGVAASHYAHASVGCLHVRPIINLKSGEDIEKMRRIADAVSNLALEFGGAMTGEHGDGILRSCWMEKMYGPRIVEAFREVKRIFDSDHLLNPHKIIDPWPMTEHLRYGPAFRTSEAKTTLDFSVHGGMAGLAGMCSGVGQCRQRLGGTMCPSYRATGDETHTTRARANALRVALSDRGLLDGLSDSHLAEVMDLCLSCKACKTECPTGVDMARLKAEYLDHRNRREGASLRDRLIANMPELAARASRFPRLVNLIAQSKPFRAIGERRYGLDRRMAPPRFASRTFRSWFRRHRKRASLRPTSRGPAVYFVDTWTNYFVPQVGIAAVELLERAGFDVRCPKTLCCGRPAISRGLLAEAAQLARTNVRKLARYAQAGVPIVGTEPSCISALADEYPQLVDSRSARQLASHVCLIESVLQPLLDKDPAALGTVPTVSPLLYHAHCHQQALFGSDDAMALLRLVGGESVRPLDAGCCGMAGSFGHEKEHYDVARAIGEQQLFPAVRGRGEAEIAVSGFSCRQQIEHHTGVQAKHVVEYLADALR